MGGNKLITVSSEMCFWLQSVPGNQLQLTVELSGGCYTDTSHVALWLTGCVYEMSAVIKTLVFYVTGQQYLHVHFPRELCHIRGDMDRILNDKKHIIPKLVEGIFNYYR